MYPATYTYWGSLATHFTWGCNGGICGASLQNITYCDINLTRGFGPEKTGPRSRTLTLVLR